jgi:hypothetical protein
MKVCCPEVVILKVLGAAKGLSSAVLLPRLCLMGAVQEQLPCAGRDASQWLSVWARHRRAETCCSPPQLPLLCKQPHQLPYGPVFEQVALHVDAAGVGRMQLRRQGRGWSVSYWTVQGEMLVSTSSYSRSASKLY